MGKQVVSRWRVGARQVIAQVLRETTGQDYGAVRAALRDAYPFGERRRYPYKVWCEEVNQALRETGFAVAPLRSRRKAYSQQAAQGTLFVEDK